MNFRSIKEKIFPPKPYQLVERNKNANLNDILAASRSWAESKYSDPFSWPYLRSALKSKSITWYDVSHAPHVIPLWWLMKFQGGEPFFKDIANVFKTYKIKSMSNYDHEYRSFTSIPPEYLFEFVDLLQHNFSAEKTTNDDVRIVVERSGEYHLTTNLWFYHKKGVSHVNLRQITHFEICDNKLFFNRKPSPFDFVFDTKERKTLQPLFKLIADEISTNVLRLERESREKASPVAVNKPGKEKDNGINPWVAGAIGVGLGVAASEMLSDD